MITIDRHTKISVILKAHPGALEAIISISPKFFKLRNPLLRKIMASRTSVSMAGKIAGCSTEDFFSRLEPLGFRINRTPVDDASPATENNPHPKPVFSPENTIELDVRPVIESGKDPFDLILKSIKKLKPGEALKIINSFEPVPLIALLSDQGFHAFTENLHDNLVHTYFYRSEGGTVNLPEKESTAADWDDMLRKFDGKIRELDVRQMEMPKPMLAIMKELGELPAGNALFVHHKRIPVFLLPELAEQNFDYRIKEISEGNVNIIIFRK